MTDHFPERNFGLNHREMEPHVFEQMWWESRYGVYERPRLSTDDESPVGNESAAAPTWPPKLQEIIDRKAGRLAADGTIVDRDRALSVKGTFVANMRAAGNPGARRYWGQQHGSSWFPGRSVGRSWVLLTRDTYQVDISTQGHLLCMSHGFGGRPYDSGSALLRMGGKDEGVIIERYKPVVIPWVDLCRALQTVASTNGVQL